MTDKKEKTAWEDAWKQDEQEHATYVFGAYPSIYHKSAMVCMEESHKLAQTVEEINTELETLKHLNEWFEAELSEMLGRKLKILEKIDKKIKFNFHMLLSKVFDTCIKALKDEEDEEE